MGPGGDHRDLDLSAGERLRVLQVIGRLNMGGPAHIAALLSGRRFHPDRYETLLVHGSIGPGRGVAGRPGGGGGRDDALPARAAAAGAPPPRLAGAARS